MENSLTRSPDTRPEAGWQRPALVAIAILLVALATWTMVILVSGSLSRSQQAVARVAFEEQTGIRLLRVAITAGGGVVDIQYQVVDPDKALIVHDDDNPPTLVDEATGLLIATPFHDHSFRELHTAVTYHELIMNGGGLLQRGSSVTLTVGGAILEHIVVQ